MNPARSVLPSSVWPLDGSFYFEFAGELDRFYIVEASTNLTTWLPLATNQANGLGLLRFTDVSATNRARSYYRMRMQPQPD